MRFSIIVPVYKAERYLSQCVESVLKQDFNDFELILVDDGSPDKSPGICDSYAEKDSRVLVIHKPNGGASDARNVGIKAAKGDYLMFIDSDDYWDDTSVLRKISSIFDETESDLVQFGQRRYFSVDDRMAPVLERNLSKFNGYSSRDILGILVQNGKLTISAASMAISRELMKNKKKSYIFIIKICF